MMLDAVAAAVAVATASAVAFAVVVVAVVHISPNVAADVVASPPIRNVVVFVMMPMLLCYAGSQG